MKKLVISSMVMLMLFSLTACGDKLYELTPEEEGAIVSYSARTVAKYNNYQSDGLVYLPAEEPETDVVEGEEENLPQETVVTEDTEEQDTSGTFGSDQKYNEEVSESPYKREDSAPKTDLSSALNLGAVKATYTGYEISKDYVAENIFSMTADPGKVFFTVKIRLQNTGNDSAYVDMLSVRPSFGLMINGEREAVAMTTVLLDDLGTYQGNLAPQDTVDTVVIFSVPDDIESRLGSIGLRVLCESEKSEVEF